MNIIKTIEEVKYNAPYFWNVSINPLATITDCLPDCTTLVVGCIKSSGLPDICSKNPNANEYHKYLINGWFSVPYSEYKSNIKVGDVIEWERGNHIAIVSEIKDNGEIWISGSFYTGENGVAYKDGKYDTRNSFTSLKQVNDFMISKYQYRYFHFVPLATESQWCGGEPEYVLVSPMSITPTEKDTSKNQIYVGVNGLRVRTESNVESQIRGTAAIGYYNVDEKVTGGNYGEGNTWYRIGEYFVAGVSGVTYYPMNEITPMEEMMALMKKMQDSYNAVCNERDEYIDMIERIRKIVC